MTNPKLTPWFTDGRPPAYPGVYNVSCQKENQSGNWYARWNGSAWSSGFVRPDYAYEEAKPANPPEYWHWKGSWRGLAEDPKTKKGKK